MKEEREDEKGEGGRRHADLQPVLTCFTLPIALPTPKGKKNNAMRPSTYQCLLLPFLHVRLDRLGAQASQPERKKKKKGEKRVERAGTRFPTAFLTIVDPSPGARYIQEKGKE